MGGSVRITRKNTDALVTTSKDIRLEVNADKSKCMVMSRDQNAGRSHCIKIDSSFFEGVEEFRYLGRTIKNQNYIREEIKNRWKSGNTLLSFGAESFVIQFAIQEYRK